MDVFRHCQGLPVGSKKQGIRLRGLGNLPETTELEAADLGFGSVIGTGP